MDVIKPKSGVSLGMLVSKSRLLSGAIKNIHNNLIRVINSDHAIVKTVEGERIAYPGDWIVKLDDDTLMVFKDVTFKLLYTKF